MNTLPPEKLVKPTPILFGIAAAGGRAVLVDGAAPLNGMQELAGTLVDRIAAMAEHAVAVGFDQLGKPLLGDLEGEFEAAGQPLNVLLRH